jgi:hypothetical protein
MKFGLLLLAACALTADAAPVTYEMTFTGIPGAPQSGTFTYDAGSGFSEFFVQWNELTFDLTASANAPMNCNNSVCVPSTAAMEFETLTTTDNWTGLWREPIFTFPGVAILTIGPSQGGDEISAQVSIPGPEDPGGGISAYAGNYDLTAAPEPATLSLLGLCGVGLIGFRRLGRVLFGLAAARH